MKKDVLKKAIIIAVSVLLVLCLSAGMATLIHKKVSVPAAVTVANGLSAYELAVENGYTGTVQEWLASLSGKSAYEIAVEGGYEGTKEEWTSAFIQLAESDIQTIKSASFNEKEQLILRNNRKDSSMNSCLEMTNENIVNKTASVVNDEIYLLTEPMLVKLLTVFPKNEEPYQIAAKFLLLDKLYSTQLFRYKKLDFLPILIENIRTIPDFDERVEKGDPTVVCEIYRGFDKKLFSFATKYCCLHNTVVYGRDDYSIYDSAVRKLLPKYAKKIGVRLTGAQLDRRYKEDNYVAFNNAVDAVLNAAEINIENRKRKFDLFLWSQR